jgi:hypothetical protein
LGVERIRDDTLRTEFSENCKAALGAGHAGYPVAVGEQSSDQRPADGAGCSCKEYFHFGVPRLRVERLDLGAWFALRKCVWCLFGPFHMAALVQGMALHHKGCCVGSTV